MDLNLNVTQAQMFPNAPVVMGSFECIAVIVAHFSECTDACNIKPHLKAFSDWLVSIGHDDTRRINVCKRKKRRERKKG